MAIILNSESEATHIAAPGTSLSWSHNVVVGSNTVLIVAINHGGTSTTTMTHNGNAMTLIGSQGGADSGYAELYYIVAPDIGSKTIAYTHSGNANRFGGGMAFDGVDQATVHRTVYKQTGASTGLTDTVSDSVTGDMVVDAFGGLNAYNISPNQGGSLGWAGDFGPGTHGASGTYEKASGSNEGTGLTWSGNHWWAYVVSALIPAPDVGGHVITFYSKMYRENYDRIFGKKNGIWQPKNLGLVGI